MTNIEVCVGRIGKAHGVRGEVSVEVRSDEPDQRFVTGATLAVRSKHPGLPTSVTIGTIRRHQDRLLVKFEEIADRSAAEAARGALLYADVPAEESPDDPEEYYDHQLVGLAVEDTDGTAIGVLAEVLHNAGQDLLVIRAGEGADGREVLVPFVTALVPTVDLAAGRIVVADRPGLVSGVAEEARES
ncbi:MAG: ribosome maturation factor RimM [Marmoricola sp.]